MLGLHFDQPHHGHWLWLVAVMLIGLVWFELKRNKTLDRFISALMQPRLVEQLGLPYRLFSIALYCLAITFFIVALMRPQYGQTVRKISRVSAQIMVCLDVSKSMLAEDAKPNRLERAKAEIADLLSLMDGDQVGITAFAGKATVACPMTTDFGFLRLVLKDLGPHSAGLGGTKLAEPIRMATEGFGEGADISRIILLITDGGDHDSFPEEAAVEASKRGVRIITVGFGDEAGSKIEITDRRTGETSFVRDSNGEPVIARLDGDLLRQLALKTNGVYIPAGTGALELESIYREHIVPLTRSRMDGTEEIIRNEAYFVFIAIGLALLLLSMLMVGLWKPSGVRKLASNASLGAFLLAFFVVVGWSERGFAQATNPESEPPTNQPQPDDASTDPVNPRETYNVAVSLMDTDLDRASEQFEAARNDAGSDGEVRFRSAYNLGWVEIKRADKLLESDPKAALSHLQSSIDWFNRSIRVRPDDKDARHNLEIVMRRAFELADSLNKKNDEDIEKRIEALIGEERTLLGEVGQIVEMAQASTATDLDGNRFREQLRQLAVRQRQLLSDANTLLDDTATELQRLNEEKSDDTPPEQLQRAAQLSYATSFLQDAAQRMGQARSQLRLRRQDRAFRRQAVAVEALKRARDAFLEPDQRIRELLQDAAPLHMQTSAYANGAASIAATDTDEFNVPAWLTSELLVDMQTSTTERTSELSQQISAGVEAMSKEQESADGDAEAAEPEKQTWQAVLIHLEEAANKFREADTEMKSDQFDSASGHQAAAILSLQRAEELLLDYRGLIEKAFADQSQIQQVLSSVKATIDPDEFTEVRDAISDFQNGNLTRAQRIRKKLREELTRLTANQPAPEGQPATGPEQQKKEADRFRKAIRLAEQLADELQQTLDAIESAQLPPANGGPEDNKTDDDSANRPELDSDETSEPPTTEPPFAEAIERSQVAVNRLHELRRLFFTIVQRLKETAQHQSNINDETLQLAIDEEFPMQSRGPIGTRQVENQSATQQIATELADQASAAVNSANGPPSPDQQAANEQMVEKHQQAAVLVADAATEMTSAAGMLQVESQFDFKKTKSVQESSLQKLLQAIALLEPPDGSDDNQDQSQDQQDNQNQEPNEDDPQEQPQNNPSQSLLQMIRDKEAQRRDDKAKRARRLVPANGPDW